ncbi:FMN-binding negative transcriptional regulator [Vannielia litorea]|uniref:Negative transcriptional regulator, PaiB family n=1 Tax=Vannielia litorea TaxID=1217970 RepID=A0A1N6HF95_9RHOB|nr:FMN-binding negative transcriptional regulator [Vannielia litorea]SIO18369.1 negative transcriptional regulator, PaiB family [Vannielia litorea]
MHPNPIYRDAPTAQSLAFAAERGFGTLCANGEALPLTAHVPFALDEATGEATLHLMRSNPLARACTAPLPARLSVMGPDSYISPDWYEMDHQVPTWNYVAVQLDGTLHPMPDDALRGVLDTLSETFEQRLLPKAPWTADKMPPDTLARLMRMIVPFRFTVEKVESTWKLSQNKPAENRQAAARQVKGYGIGQEVALLAALMLGAE